MGPARSRGLASRIVTRINSEVAAILREAETVKWFTSQAAEPAPATPDAFRKMIASELQRWEKAARDTGITLQ